MQKPAAWSSSTICEASSAAAAIALLCLAPGLEGGSRSGSADFSGEAPGQLFHAYLLGEPHPLSQMAVAMLRTLFVSSCWWASQSTEIAGATCHDPVAVINLTDLPWHTHQLTECAGAQAAIEARLARLPLYTYAQLSSRHGVQKQSRRGRSSSVLSASEQQGLAWYDTLGSERRRTVHMPAMKPRQQRQGLIWYDQLSRRSKPSLQQSQQRSS